MTSKRWLGTLARHYPSLLVSGVCHKALGEIEELEAKLATITTTLNHYAASDGLLAPLAAAVLREIEEIEE